VTAISRTLAALIANDWQAKTCWVDLNWWKTGTPSQESDLFSVTVADVLDGRGRFHELPVETSVPHLSMVAAGEIPISSRFQVPKDERLAKILADLANTFDHLILDLPPVLVTSDAVSLAGLTNGYLLVVLQRATSSAQVGAALEAMTSAPCLGTILNGARTRVPRWLLSSNEMWAIGDSS
jgi:Mrp family chromosome partitioning ATPase